MSEETARVQVVAGLLLRHGQVLLCHRHPDRLNYPAVWDLPGGHVEEGETMGDALVRELAEELGIEIEKPDQPQWVSVLFDGIEMNVYVVDDWIGEPWIAAPDEHDALGWFGREDLPRLALAHPDYFELLAPVLPET